MILFRLLLRLYPHDFRRRFARDMERSFRSELEHARRKGRTRAARLWTRTVIDLLVGAMVERSSALRRRTTTRSTRGDPLMSSIVNDIRFGARSFLKRPGFTAVVVFTLALGIGANTAIFSVVNTVLLRPLPYEEPDRLAFLWGRMTETSVARAPFSGPDLADFREGSEVFESFGAIFSASSTLSGEYEAEHIRLGSTTLDFFDVMGASPVVGRGFEDRDRLDMDPSVFFDPTATPPPSVIVLSYDLWQRRYGGDREVLGRRVRVNGQPMTVVGVAPPGFRLFLPADASIPGEVDVWTPLPSQLDQGPRDAQWLTVVGRLEEGATWERARAEMNAIAGRFRKENRFHDNVGLHIDVAPMHADVVSHVRPILMALLGAVGFVLLIACANVANLLLVRAGGREAEIAVRMAMGGSRRRLLRQMLTESALLAVAGGVLGVALAAGGIEVLAALRPDNLPRGEHVGIDGRVLAVVVGISFLAAFLFGLAPALQAARTELSESLASRGGGERRGSQRLKSTLVVGEVALSLVLLVGAGLMVRTFASLQRVDPGFDPEGVLTVNVTAPFFKYRAHEERVRFFNRVADELEALPGVESLGGVTPLPLAGLGQLWFGPYALSESEEEWSRNEGDYRVLYPGFFETVDAEVLQGRSLTRADSEPDAQPVVVVDETLARKMWPGEDPVGRELLVMRPATSGNGFDRFWSVVVGVVEHIRYDDLTADSRETIYFPLRDWSFAEVSFTLATRGDPAALTAAVRRAVLDVDPDVAPATIRPFAGYVEDATAQVRYALLLIGAFAGAAVLLTVVGLYGVISYSVSRRTREFGIRMAFGAERGQIQRRVLGRGMVLALVGVALGWVGAALLTRSLSSLLYEVSATDPLTFTGVAALLAAVACLASWIPARRATRVNPSEALRTE